MPFYAYLEVFNYGLVLLFGLFLSTLISGGWTTLCQKRLIMISCPIFLLLQGICWMRWGAETVRHWYPLLAHIPLVLLLIFALKKRAGVALVSVCTAYLLCQLPRWMNLMFSAITGSVFLGELCYLLSIIPIFFLLRRFFVRAAHDAMTYSKQSLLLFGSLPVAYYMFDYATAVYLDAQYLDATMLIEFLPTVLILFYVLFLSAYHMQTQNRMRVELQSSMLEAELKQSQLEIEGLHHNEKQTAIYQHNMRHHLSMISSYLNAQQPDQAIAYIQKTQADIAAISPMNFCENITVNLLCSAFYERARISGVRLGIKSTLPNSLSIPDTELCTVISNGLENALNATRDLEEPLKWVDFYCEIKLNKLLIEIKNPYSGTVCLSDGLPISRKEGHGYGCKSIKTIAEKYRGLSVFNPDDGLFILRIVLPLPESMPSGNI